VLETRLTYLSDGIVFGEVCITLAARCLCAPLFYPEGPVILQHTNRVCGVATNGVLEGTRAAAFWPEAQ
jgi:hypothetical protein